MFYTLVNLDLHRFFKETILNISELERLSSEIEKWDIKVTDIPALKLEAEERIFYEIKNLENTTNTTQHLTSIISIIEILKHINIDLVAWKSQNYYFSLLNHYKNGSRKFSSPEWENDFTKLGELLKIKSQ